MSAPESNLNLASRFDSNDRYDQAKREIVRHYDDVDDGDDGGSDDVGDGDVGNRGGDGDGRYDGADDIDVMRDEGGCGNVNGGKVDAWTMMIVSVMRANIMVKTAMLTMARLERQSIG